MEPLIIVDAENVRRSQWPNLGREELVELSAPGRRRSGPRRSSSSTGPAPSAEADESVQVVGTTKESADDRIARDAERLARAGRPYRLVTSDRGLRARAGGDAEDVIGGGTFAPHAAGGSNGRDRPVRGRPCYQRSQCTIVSSGRPPRGLELGAERVGDRDQRRLHDLVVRDPEQLGRLLLVSEVEGSSRRCPGRVTARRA